VISLAFEWLLTYLVHSSVLLGCAALLDWRRRLTSRGMSSALWRMALFGGFITATLQPVLRGLLGDFQRAATTTSTQPFTDPFFAVVLPPLEADVIDLAPLLMPVWLGIAGGGAAYLLLRLIRVVRATGRMPDLASVAVQRSAHQLAMRARIPPPRLRVGAHLRAPLVAPGRVICIPAWMLDRYEASRLTAALAHEMAHLRRHDNAWRIAGRFAAQVGWLQPFNRLALKRTDESAELSCDAWAAAAGSGRELACALEDCAVRLGSPHPGSAVTIGMAANRFRLLERVQKLLEDAPVNTQSLRRAARWSSALLLAVAVAGSFLVVSTLDDDVPPRWLAANGLYQSLVNRAQSVHFVRSVVVKSPEKYVFIRVTENFSFAERDPARATTGTAVISETRGGVTRSVRYERGSHSELRRLYKVNGRVQALDAEAEQWLATMMPMAAPPQGAS
jgi:beta-lactamase regulating signal transducer with metallopeptidase domain